MKNSETNVANGINYDLSPSYQINNLANQINIRVDRMVKKLLQVSLTEWRVVAIVANENGTTQQRLMDVVALDRSVVSRALQGLKKNGFIEARTDKDDARLSRIYVTQKGAELYKNSEHLAIEGDENLLFGLNEKELETLFTLLEKVANNLPRVGFPPEGRNKSK